MVINLLTLDSFYLCKIPEHNYVDASAAIQQ